MSNLVPQTQSDIMLPALPEQTLPAIASLITALGIPRNALATDEEIAYAWRDLPRELRAIPPELKSELIARMCVAVSVGLFDGAINYIWNATVLHMRQRIKDFGLSVVAQIQQKDFEEKHLIELQDVQLLELCLKLNLVTEDGFFFLDQCRDTRNNFSAAHPTIGKINDKEFTTFLNRCVRYALSNESSPRGVDIGSFISAMKMARFSHGQCDVWRQRIDGTHDAQRQLLFVMVHGIYCDPASAEPARLNALDLCMACQARFTTAIKSDLINRHSDYLAKGDIQRYNASQQFFERLGLLNSLNESERHALISGALENLWIVHQSMNNFYNEPSFAERLRKLSEQAPTPETAQEQFVQVVVSCYIGNGYGVSRAAEPHYISMIRSFSPREVGLLVAMTRGDSVLARRIQSNSLCRRRLVQAMRLIDSATVPSLVRADYNRWVQDNN